MRTPIIALSLLIFLVSLACDPAPRGLLDPGTKDDKVEEISDVVDEEGEAAGAEQVGNDTDFATKPVAIGMVVKDLVAAENFYGKVLGLEPAGGFEVDTDFARRSGLTDGATLPVKQYTFGKGPGVTTLKLIEVPGVSRHETSNYVPDDHGVQYLTIYVNDVTDIKQRLEAAGIPYKGEGPINIGTEEAPKDFILVQDPDGTFIELIEE